MRRITFLIENCSFCLDPSNPLIVCLVRSLSSYLWCMILLSENPLIHMRSQSFSGIFHLYNTLVYMNSTKLKEKLTFYAIEKPSLESMLYQKMEGEISFSLRNFPDHI